MNQPKLLFSLAAFFIVCLSFNAFAQTPPVRQSEPSYDIILQTVVGSNDGVKSEMPSTLSGIVKKIKVDFSFSNYRLAATSIQRVANRGGAESKSVSYPADKSPAVFSEWTISDLESLIDSQGQETIQIRNFRFGQRVPFASSNSVITYEQIGISTRFSLPKNTPTVVGSLATAKPDELMFLVLTVKSSEK